MTDFIMPFVIIALIAVIIIQAVERYFFEDQANHERHELLKFMLSRNATEYAQVSKMEKEPSKKEEELLNDEIDLADASPEEYDKFIKNITR